MGLLGIGKAGIWHIELDDISGSESSGLSISTPALYVQASIPNLDVIRNLIAFLLEPAESVEFRLATLFAGQLTLFHLEERLHFMLRVMNQPAPGDFPDLIEVTFDAAEGTQFAAALRDLLDDVNRDYGNEDNKR